MKILVRLPNWMGDMVMSTAFVRAVQDIYPTAEIDLIAKKGIDVLLDYFPPHGKRYIFSKEEYPSLSGAWKFGKQISRSEKYDLFFCLPDSLSSAVMAFASGAAKKIGYRKEGRALLLSHPFHKQTGRHRVEEYVDLLRQFSGQEPSFPVVSMQGHAVAKQDCILVNINSEAVSRRLPTEKAIRIIDAIRKAYSGTILLVGSNKEAAFVDEVYTGLESRSNIVNVAGHTGIPELVGFIQSAKAVLSTDSGPAHLANALGTPLLVLFGAGNEKNTGPFGKEHAKVIRLNQLACEPCTSNQCKQYNIPRCLTALDEQIIVAELKQLIHNSR